MSETKLATKADLKEMYDRMLPYMGGMPEMLANKFSKGDLYSTDEKIIGQWIDGKPLYQKTIVKNNFTISNDTSFTHGITNVDKIFIKEGFIDDNGSFVMMPLLWSTSYNGVLIDATKIVFKGTGTWEAQLTRTLYFVIQYTKTTDSPISIGNDTDYSTEEKIVGTWIDGKPIYQRTWVVQSEAPTGTARNQNLFSLSGLNIDDVLDISGTLKRADGQIWKINTFGTSADNIEDLNNQAYNTFVFIRTLNGAVSSLAFNTGSISNNGNPFKNATFRITLQYTKTT